MKLKNNTDNSLKLSIGDIPLLITVDNTDFMRQIRKTYSNFVVEKPESPLKKPDSPIKIGVNILPLKDAVFKFSPHKEAPEISINKPNGIATMLWHNLYGEFNLKTLECRVKCTVPAALNSFLRFVYSTQLLNESGFLVHASSLIREGEGYLFPGKSGAGKTTITQLSPDAVLLTDEVSLVKKVNGNYHIFGTPFWGELAIGGENTHVPIKSVYFPKKDKSLFKKNINTIKVMEMLLPNVLLYSEDEEFTLQLFNICMDFAGTVPCYELHFLPEPSFWRIIDDK